MIVTNTTPLIALGKQGKINILQLIFNKIIVPEAVFREIQYKSENPETLAVMAAIKEGWMNIEKASVKYLPDTLLLGEGEKEAISLAAHHRSIFLTDDKSAKSFALVQGIESHGTLYVLTRAILKEIIAKEEARALLDKMIASGFYVSINAYAGFIDALKES